MKPIAFVLAAPSIAAAQAVQKALLAAYPDTPVTVVPPAQLQKILRGKTNHSVFLVLPLDDHEQTIYSDLPIVSHHRIFYRRELSGNVQLFQALKLPLPTVPERSEKLLLQTNDAYHIVHISEILYCRAEDNYTYFHLRDQPALCVSKPLREYEGRLAGHAFFRVHKSYLVNLEEVSRIIRKGGDYAIMSNTDKVPLSSRKKGAFIQLFKSECSL